MNRSEQDELQAATRLWRDYKPAEAAYAFEAKDIQSARRWQSRTRRALARLVGLDAIPSVPAHVRVVEEVDKGDYVRRKVVLDTAPGSVMPVYLLLPKERPAPHPVVLAFHGHGYGVKDIVGLWEDGKERDTPDGYQKDFAIALCRAGFAVAAPEISGFGERQTDFSHLNAVPGQPVPSSCTHMAMLAFHLGTSVIGLRVHDGMRLVDYLQTQAEFDTGRLGAMGISGGGMHTFFSTCLDTRIRASVVSGYFSTFRDSTLGMLHCACTCVPGLAAFGEMHDLSGLIAPRPMLVEAGNYDPIFPMRAVRAGVAAARRVYDVFDSATRLETDYFEGRHEINGRKAYRFLARELAV